MTGIDDFLVLPESTIYDILACIDRNTKGIALVVDAERHLLGTITDGDIRRGILAQIALSSPATDLLAHKATYNKSVPISAPLTTPLDDMINIMQTRRVRQLPLLDADKRVVKLVTLDQLLTEIQPLPLTAVVMAGGFGTRLRPLTEDIPKPMLPIGERPMMEWILQGLKKAGISRFIVTTHYKADVIIDHFGDGSRLGIHIDYIREEKLTGTAGPLMALTDWDTPLLVINGDILTNVDFRSMYHYHVEHRADMTVAMREHDIKVPYATINLDGARITGLTEKPTLQFFINAGIYIIEPAMRRYIRSDETFLDMPDFVDRLLEAEQAVVGFPITEYWLDIGQHTQYEQAQTDIHTMQF